MPFNPNQFSGAPSPSQLSRLAGKEPDPELVGEQAIKLNLVGGGATKLSGMGIGKPVGSGGNVSMPVSGNTTPVNVPGGTPGAPVVALPTSGGNSGTLGLTPPGTSTQSVLTTAAALATEDDFRPFPTATPNLIVMPEHYIFGDPGNEGAPPPPPLVTSDGGGSGAGAPPPPPPKEPTRPPLVSAPPKKKTSPWLWLGLAAIAAAAAFS